MDFLEKLDKAVTRNNSLLCVGLDPVLDKLPEQFRNTAEPFFEFGKSIADATHEAVCAYKPNSAFYEALGAEGIKQLKKTCDYIRSNYPDIPIILDAKRGDIGLTNEGYAASAFDYLGCDAITLSPYMGQKSLEPFLARKDKGCIILCQTSNEGADEFQSLESGGKKLYRVVAEAVVNDWNKNGNCLLVTGATYAEELKDIRQIAGDNMVFLVPGMGIQGGEIEPTLRAGINSKGRGLIINSSRAIIYSDDPKKSAEELKKQINQHR